MKSIRSIIMDVVADCWLPSHEIVAKVRLQHAFATEGSIQGELSRMVKGKRLEAQWEDRPGPRGGRRMLYRSAPSKVDAVSALVHAAKNAEAVIAGERQILIDSHATDGTADTVDEVARGPLRVFDEAIDLLRTAVATVEGVAP